MESDYLKSRLCPKCIKPTIKRLSDITKGRCDHCGWVGYLRNAPQWLGKSK